jgi:hypothetical protein
MVRRSFACENEQCYRQNHPPSLAYCRIGVKGKSPMVILPVQITQQPKVEQQYDLSADMVTKVQKVRRNKNLADQTETLKLNAS